MKQALSLFILIILFLSPQAVKSQDYKASAGLRLGTYFAVSVKSFISEKAAIEGIGGITRIGGQSLISVGGFYTIHNQFASDIPTLKWYYGGGTFVALGSNDIKTNVALTAIIGLEYTFETTPINIFMDAVPFVSLINSRRFDSEASMGVRYIF